MQEYYEKLEILGYEVGAHEGTHLFHQAISMKCISMVRKNDHKTARELLEKSYQTQLKQVENDETHPFVESTLSHLGLICKIGRDLSAAENYYTKLIDIKVKFYGENHETIANPMKNLGNVLQLAQKYDEAKVIYENCETILRHNLEHERENKQYRVKIWLQTLKDVVYYLFALYDRERNEAAIEQAIRRIKQHCEICIEIYGEDSDETAHSLYLQGKSLLKYEKHLDEAKQALERALKIHTEQDKDMKQPIIKSRILHSLGNVVFKLGDVAKAKEHFELARGVILNQAEYLDLIKETDTKIKECCEKLG